jgi:hemin uptake protein HemP
MKKSISFFTIFLFFACMAQSDPKTEKSDSQANVPVKVISSNSHILSGKYKTEVEHKGAYYQITYLFSDSTYISNFEFEGEKVSNCKGVFLLSDSTLTKKNRIYTFERLEDPQPPEKLPDITQKVRNVSNDSFDLFLPDESEENIAGIWITLKKITR